MFAINKARRLPQILYCPLLRPYSSNKPNLKIPDFVEKDLATQDYSKTTIASFLWPYIYPRERRLKVIMGSTFVLLIASKSINVGVPFLLKEGVNALMVGEHANFVWASVLFGGFAAGRALTVLFSELRNSLFSKIVLNAVRDVCNKLFWHL